MATEPSQIAFHAGTYEYDHKNGHATLIIPRDYSRKEIEQAFAPVLRAKAERSS